MQRVAILLFFVLWGCSGLEPEQPDQLPFPEVSQLISSGLAPQEVKLTKEVWLDEKSELLTLTPDTAAWKKEFDFLNEINPNQPEYTGAFNILSSSEDQLILALKEGEKPPLQELSLTKKGENRVLKARVLEEKQLFTLEKSISVVFEDGKIQKYRIEGYQKILLKDTARFRISGIVKQ